MCVGGGALDALARTSCTAALGALVLRASLIAECVQRSYGVLTYAPPAPRHVQNSFSKFRKNRRQELRHKAYVSKDKGRRSTVEKDRLRLKFLDACKSYVC